jgi:hypothetical protein
MGRDVGISDSRIPDLKPSDHPAADPHPRSRAREADLGIWILEFWIFVSESRSLKLGLSSGAHDAKHRTPGAASWPCEPAARGARMIVASRFFKGAHPADAPWRESARPEISSGDLQSGSTGPSSLTRFYENLTDLQISSKSLLKLANQDGILCVVVLLAEKGRQAHLDF